MTSRIEQLQHFIAEDPTDPFPRYGLALEYLHDQPQRARAVFEELLATFPDYLPAYYPAAHLMIDLQQPQEAERLFQQGMAIAAQQGNQKTERELRQAYNQWLFERE